MSAVTNIAALAPRRTKPRACAACGDRLPRFAPAGHTLCRQCHVGSRVYQSARAWLEVRPR